MNASLPSEIAEWLANPRRSTEEIVSGLAKAAKKLEDDPEFHTEYVKARFVEDALQAMTAEGVTQSQLARKWGRSRQFLSKLLREDKRVNFTIETMVELSLLLRRKLEIHMLKQHEAAHVIRCVPQQFRPVANICSGRWEAPGPTRGLKLLPDYETAKPFTPSKSDAAKSDKFSA